MKIWLIDVALDPPLTVIRYTEESAKLLVDYYNQRAEGSWGKASIEYEGEVYPYTKKESLDGH